MNRTKVRLILAGATALVGLGGASLGGAHDSQADRTPIQSPGACGVLFTALDSTADLPGVLHELGLPTRVEVPAGGTISPEIHCSSKDPVDGTPGVVTTVIFTNGSRTVAWLVPGEGTEQQANEWASDLRDLGYPNSETTDGIVVGRADEAVNADSGRSQNVELWSAARNALRGI